MSISPSAHRHWSVRGIPRLVFVFGAIALVSFLISLPTETPGIAILPETIVEVLLLGLPAIGLLYAGYFLQNGEFEPEQLASIGSTAIAGVFLAVTGSALAIAMFSGGQLSTRGVLFLLTGAGSEGAFFGLIIGVFAFTDRLRRQSEALLEQHEHYQYLERVGEIGYWEIRPAEEPPYPVYATDGMYQILDQNPDQSLDVERGLETTHPEDRARLESAVERAFSEGEPWDMEIRVQTGDDETQWVHTVGDPVIDGDQVQFVRGMLQEITTQKQYELDLERQNERLDEFVSVVSHDLRNPLGVATGRLELAREELEHEDLEAVARALQRMDGLIDDFLTLAREGESITELQSVVLAEVIRDCWHTVDTADAELDLDTECTLRADPGRLRQLLENLIRNAVEHGGDGVTVHAGDLEDGFFIEDDGKGIPPAESDRIFEAGYSSRPEGTGFGLSIVKRAADAHGWDVKVTEGSQGGARFEFTGVTTE